MADGMKPTEEYDGSVVVRAFSDGERTRSVRCASFREAIDTVKQKQASAAVVEIINQDGDVVFDSVDMDIEDWEAEWKHAKRRMSVEVEERECPYSNVACFADDFCVQCKMDKIQVEY